MGNVSAQISPVIPSRRSKKNSRQQDVVKLMMPVFFCREPCTNNDIELAKVTWDMIINDRSPEFNMKRGQPNFEFSSCVMLFYSTFYARLFDVHPMSRPMFTNGLSGQGNFLVGMISMCLTEISLKDTAFTNRLIRLTEVHNDRGVKAVEYGIVGEVMFWTIRHCVGSDIFSSEVQFAWMKIFSRMLSIMVPVAVSYEMKSKSIAQSERLSDSSGSDHTKSKTAQCAMIKPSCQQSSVRVSGGAPGHDDLTKGTHGMDSTKHSLDEKLVPTVCSLNPP